LIKPFGASASLAITDVWATTAVQADVSSFTGDGVVVAVLDTGIDKMHPAFNGLNIVERDFTGAGNGDRHGHGTHCAGTIFGRDVDGTRIGVARGVKNALIGKVLNDAGSGSSEMLYRGIQWAVEQGAHVICMSLGFDFPASVKDLEAAGLPTMAAVSNALDAYRSNLRFFDALMQMVKARAAFGETAVVVAASGNESKRTGNPAYTVATSVPAAADSVVSVGALGRATGGKLEIASFSNTGPQVVAPGENIVSAKLGGGMYGLSGTSVACSHAAGVAALWWEALRSSNQVRPNASLVMSNILGRARTDVLVPSVTSADRGYGIVTAPQ
jgi:subtilisin family serine protease